MDILKKRNIDIISEIPFRTNTFLNKRRNERKKENKKKFNNPKLDLPVERQELLEYDEGVKYLVFTTVFANYNKRPKHNPEDFAITKEVNINLKGYLQLMKEESEREREKMKTMEIKKKKVHSNYLYKIKGIVHKTTGNKQFIKNNNTNNNKNN